MTKRATVLKQDGRLMRLVTRLRTKALRAPDCSDPGAPPILTLGTLCVSGVRPIPTGKTQLLGWLGCVSGQPVKIYETFSSGHAEFIENVSGVRPGGEALPAVLHRESRYVVAEWVPGEVLSARKVVRDRLLLARLVQTLLRFHGQSYQSTGESFDYPTWLVRRLRDHSGPFEVCRVEDEWLTAGEEALRRLDVPVRISHPDFTPRNIVVEKATGRLKVIDNELLGQSRYYLIDLFNLHAALGGGIDTARSLIGAYAGADGDVSPLVKAPGVFANLWNIRTVGASLQAGALPRALREAETHLNGDGSHPILQAAREAMR